ncbi:MAG: hypothetical protein QM831_18665 [Kofleriaceae bacterium]
MVLAACATSRPGDHECDQTSSSCGDASVPTPDAAPAWDAAPDGPNKGFGEPCTDGSQCSSTICIVVSTGGVCTSLCSNDDCPPGYGCLAVTGAVDPDQVTQVCVPISDQLCTPCVHDSECTLIGMDKCETETSGRSYCARDCSSVACPSGYDCVQDGATKQCEPHSGACDCNTVGQMGTTEACTIMTPLNTQCAGTSTCAGVGGWAACAPPSTTDDPDATYADTNCDGIDGDASKGIFVAGGGANSATCGLTYSTPCQTISYGIVRAVQASRNNVYVQAGTYNEVMVLVSGVNVWGGYDFNWQRNAYSNAANRVTVIGAQDNGTGGDGEWLTVRAHDLIVPVKIDNMILQGPTATGVGGISGRDGRSSYVVHARGAAGLTLSHVQIVAGNGAAGLTGGAGTDAVTVDVQSFMNGGGGGNGDEYTTTCDSSSRGTAGGAGTNSCAGSPSTRATNGGNGGVGGTMDTSCGFPPHYDATAGASGMNAVFNSSPFGIAGSGGSGTDACGTTTSGNGGLVANGAAGGGATNGGYLAGTGNSYWYARSGGAGGTGENGTGGGGGGGGGGCDSGTDAYGAGGGGGAAGGCAARGGGTGGGGGGGSFGVFSASASQITLNTCALYRGNAGGAGTGGVGGRGQSGGTGGSGGASHPGSATPGNGGGGAHGGHGGGGGGGQGGRSIGVVNTGDSTITGTCTQTGGSAGGGGNGGVSAPNAPASDRDGANGGNGGAGTLEEVHTCASSTSC